MIKILQSDIHKNQVVYTFDQKDSKGKYLSYAIPRTFTAEEVDLTLAAHIRDLSSKEPATTSVDDWALNDDDLHPDAINERVEKIEKNREAENKKRLKRMEDVRATANKIEIEKPSPEREEEMLTLAKNLEDATNESQPDEEESENESE